MYMRIHPSFCYVNEPSAIIISIFEEKLVHSNIESNLLKHPIFSISPNDIFFYIEKHERGLIRAIRKDTDNTIDDRMIIAKKQKWEKKQPYGLFKRLINTISREKTWAWLRKSNFQSKNGILPNSSTGQRHKNQTY